MNVQIKLNGTLVEVELLIGGFPVNIKNELKQGQVLQLQGSVTDGVLTAEWVNVDSTALEIAICGKTTSPDVTPQDRQALIFNADDNVWQPS